MMSSRGNHVTDLSKECWKKKVPLQYFHKIILQHVGETEVCETKDIGECGLQRQQILQHFSQSNHAVVGRE